MNYSGKQQFKMTHDFNDDISCVIEVDFDRPHIFSEMQEYYEFYHKLEAWDKKTLLDKFLKHLAAMIHFVSGGGNLNTYGVREEMREMEGYPLLDVSTGFELLTHENIQASEEDFEVEKVSGYKYKEPEDF